MLSRGIPCHPQLRVHPAVPVELQQVLRGLLARIDANLMQHRAPKTFFELLRPPDGSTPPPSPGPT